eukprot:TRINITY_DN100875_c0_g1_i1.p1 TRINITY_DN100875_c0_g1~~TRINITY_DN100875_c0_g1_i1.p1  ORF type:complete len:320 (-),score=57.12 TRINITY_DN100875_c0_g1_i1:62-1021(-)
MHATNPLIRGVSLLPVAFVLLLFAFEFYSYNFKFTLLLCASDDGSLSGWVQFRTALFNAAWLLAIWSYLRCTFADPGLVREEWHRLMDSEECTELGSKSMRPPITAAKYGWQPGRASHCSHCSKTRPERAHHCRVCGACVMRMDHHCPWVGNCVGFKNHKFFMLFNFYTSLACIIFALSAASVLKASLFGNGFARSGQLAGKKLSAAFGDGMYISMGGLVAVSFGIALMTIFCAHIFLGACNMTALEVAFSGQNPYNKGMWRNLQSLMGAPDLTWLLPVAPAKPLDDGMIYPLADWAANHELVRAIGRPISDKARSDDL